MNRKNYIRMMTKRVKMTRTMRKRTVIKKLPKQAHQHQSDNQKFVNLELDLALAPAPAPAPPSPLSPLVQNQDQVMTTKTTGPPPT